MEGEVLGRYLEQIGPYLRGGPPRDISEERKLDPAAQGVSRRMFYVPSAGGLHVAGQVSYRPADREGQPDTCFAHVLLQEEDGAEPRWTALDWLRLWDAPGWVHEDSADLPRVLPTLASPADLVGQTPMIDDRALVIFLRGAVEPVSKESFDAAPIGEAVARQEEDETPAGLDAESPPADEILAAPDAEPQEAGEVSAPPDAEPQETGEVSAPPDADAQEAAEAIALQAVGAPAAALEFLPERWRIMDPRRRRGWVGQVLSAYLEAVAAEPASPCGWSSSRPWPSLWAYAVARLLPPGALRNEVGFSTFEADPAAARGTLMATWPDDPQAAAAALEGGRLPVAPPPGVVVNTLDEDGHRRARPMHKYAAAILQELIDRGGEAVDRDLAAFAAAKVVRPSQLESLGAADEIVSALLETGTLADDVRRSSPQATLCVRLRLGQRLSNMADLDAGRRPWPTGRPI